MLPVPRDLAVSLALVLDRKVYLGNDWRQLGINLDFKFYEIIELDEESSSSKSSPSIILLQRWFLREGRSGNYLKKLHEAVTRIEPVRTDALLLFSDYLHVDT